jgi:hypothetical protein
VPALRRFIALFTSLDADLEYRAMIFSPLNAGWVRAESLAGSEAR